MRDLNQMRWPVRPLARLAALALCLAPLAAPAQSVARWTTNFYTVTGASLPELRHSIQQARPWKESQPTDAITDWRVNWQFTVQSGADGCRLRSVSISTTIATTLPRWHAPTNADPGTLRAWTHYLLALGRHEAGHGQIGLMAAAEIEKRFHAHGAAPDCESLKAALNALGHRIVAEHRQRDLDYDARTRHGATQGAVLPGRLRRER